MALGSMKLSSKKESKVVATPKATLTTSSCLNLTGAEVPLNTKLTTLETGSM